MVQNISNSNLMLNTKAEIIASQKQDESVKNGSSKKAESSSSKENVDKVVKENKTDGSGVYKKPEKLNADQLRAITEQRMESYKSMLTGMLGKQVINFKKTTFDGLMSGKLNASSIESAKESIAPGGEWSPEKVAGRILDMAKTLSGGDASKYDLLKNAAIKGFGAAKKDWGDELPSITKETYKMTMKNFEDWKTELDKKAEGDKAPDKTPDKTPDSSVKTEK